MSIKPTGYKNEDVFSEIAKAINNATGILSYESHTNLVPGEIPTTTITITLYEGKWGKSVPDKDLTK